jgi:hypothetical protein
MDEATVKKRDGRLCLVRCPRCFEAKHKSGAYHLALGHTGAHECDAERDDMHTWP